MSMDFYVDFCFCCQGFEKGLRQGFIKFTVKNGWFVYERDGNEKVKKKIMDCLFCGLEILTGLCKPMFILHDLEDEVSRIPDRFIDDWYKINK